ncbi:MAG: hypothetical protein Q4D50_12890 [Eubacteriales bacterium]|nr:hypothetical protein [Eubacteriales bacterium]
MNREDIFLAIGAVEESRLARCDLAVQGPSHVKHEEEPAMKKRKISAGRIVRNILVAALILSMVSMTAYAAVGYLIFDSPSEMLTSIFGDKTGYDHKDVTHWTDPEKPDKTYDNPAYDRVPADEDVVASEAAPLVSPVGQSISWKGYTLTVDANLYDEVTQCGILTYTIENPDGLPHYEIGENGEVWFPGGEIVDCNQYGKSYLIQDKTTSTKLTAAYYYQLRYPNTTDLVLTFCQWAAISHSEVNSLLEKYIEEVKTEMTLEEAMADLKQRFGDGYDEYVKDMTQEQLEYAAYFWPAYQKLDAQYTCPDVITIPEQALGEMSHVTLADGSITISPIAMCIDIAGIQDYPSENNEVAKIRFEDGTEYLIRDDNTANYIFAVGSSGKQDVTYMFNRMIDVNEIASVILDNGLAFSVN